jgi:hypothetical protein
MTTLATRGAAAPVQNPDWITTYTSVAMPPNAGRFTGFRVSLLWRRPR